ncbi:mrna transport regulator, partial [Moniliophthora roreri]
SIRPESDQIGDTKALRAKQVSAVPLAGQRAIRGPKLPTGATNRYWDLDVEENLRALIPNLGVIPQPSHLGTGENTPRIKLHKSRRSHQLD